MKAHNPIETLSERDQAHIWHPLTQHRTSGPPIGIVRAKGALLFDEGGNEYIDGIASWYTAMYGHCNDMIIERVTAQLHRLDQVVFTGFTHQPAVSLSEKLIALLPENQKKIFFNDNGSTAVEAAIKMAFQYHHNKGKKRDTLIAFEYGFHGDCFGTMSVSGIAAYNGPFADHFLKVERIPTPDGSNTSDILTLLEKITREHACAAFVYEPLVQGAAGMKFHDAAGLASILEYLRGQGILLIADEVMTGFGKTGKYFASEYVNEHPDIMCLSKSLTAGVAPMGITSTSREVFDAFLDASPEKGFFHAHTYSANPLACAAAVAGIDLLVSETIQQSIERITELHNNFMTHIGGHSNIRDIRTLGVILAMDLDTSASRYGALRDQLYDFCMERGVYLRPLGNTIYLLPPFVISEEQLKKCYRVIEEALSIV